MFALRKGGRDIFCPEFLLSIRFMIGLNFTFTLRVSHTLMCMVGPIVLRNDIPPINTVFLADLHR